jgi:phosphate transport system protein
VPERAREVLGMDDRVDALLKQIYDERVADAETGGNKFLPVLQLLSTAKYLERIADHATNVAEDVIYMATGEVVKHQL